MENKTSGSQAKYLTIGQIRKSNNDPLFLVALPHPSEAALVLAHDLNHSPPSDLHLEDPPTERPL